MTKSNILSASNGLSDADHLDGNRMNPALENLEWVAHTGNVRRAHEKEMYSGRSVGENNPKAKLTADIAVKLRAEYRSGMTVMDTAPQKAAKRIIKRHQNPKSEYQRLPSASKSSII